MESANKPTQIGSLNEKPLHAALKAWCAGPSDQFEVSIAGFVIDIVQDGCLVEIQTRNFSAIKRKLIRLTADHRVRLVYPIAAEKWIIKPGKHGTESRRKSPKRGRLDQVFEELVSIPRLLDHPNFSLLLLLIREEEVRYHDARRAWRRKGWVTQERRLIDVLDQRLVESPADMAAFLPENLCEPFTTSELAVGLGRPRWFAQKMAYCLREAGVIAQVGTRARAVLYSRISIAARRSSTRGRVSPSKG